MIDPERIRRLEKQLGILFTHPVFSKFLQGGPLAIPAGGMLLGGRRIIGGAPVGGQALIWNATLERFEPTSIPGGLIAAFLGLTDTPGSYLGQASRGVRVNAGETALEFYAIAAGHAAVTLAADAQVLLNLSIQELGLVAKAANLIFAGPAAGGAADPTFRALVVADIPAAFLTVTEADALYEALGDIAIHASDPDAHGGKVSKSYLYEFPDEDMAVGDFIPENAIRIPAAGKHGNITWGTAYARCETVGAGTNTILFRTSTTLTGARTTRATINLGTAREASGAITLTEVDGMYLWVECSAVGGTAPKKVTVQVDCEEAVY